MIEILVNQKKELQWRLLVNPGKPGEHHEPGHLGLDP